MFLLKKDKRIDHNTINRIKSWESQLPSDEDVVKARKVALDKIRAQYTNKRVVVEADEKGNLHCGECLIKEREKAPLDAGDSVRIVSINENTDVRTSRIYPAYVARWEY